MRRGAALAAAAIASGGMGGPAGAAAQETPADTAVYRLGTLEATVARTGLPLSLTPLSISTVDARAAAEGGRQLDLHEALRRVPGVAVDNRHNASLGSRISIRGIGARSAFGVRGIRILLDGIPLTLPDGQSTLANVDLGTIERVEVIRGPAGMLYGNAAGGVVALHSTQPPTEGMLETRWPSARTEPMTRPICVRSASKVAAGRIGHGGSAEPATTGWRDTVSTRRWSGRWPPASCATRRMPSPC